MQKLLSLFKFRLHWFYYFLAFLDLCTVSFSLYLNYQLSENYKASIEINEHWTRHLSELNDLRYIAGMVNAPGNDIFQSGDIIREKENFNRIIPLFEQKYNQMLEEAIIYADHKSLMPTLKNIHLAMNDMINSTEEIFSHYEKGETDLAAASMAYTDQKNVILNSRLSELQQQIILIQNNLFQSQNKYSGEIRKNEISIAILILIMILCITLYGQQLAKQTQKSEAEKNTLIESLGNKTSELKELLSRSQTLDNVIDQMSAVSQTDDEGNITYVNSKLIECSQYSREELMGQNHRMLKSGVHDKAFFANLWQTVKSGNIWRGEVLNKAKDGTLFWSDSIAAPIFGENNTIKGYLSFRHNITQKKKLEQQQQQLISDLKEAKERLSLATSAANIGIWDWDQTKKESYCNDITKSILEMDETQNFIKVINHSLGDEDKQKINDKLKNALETQKLFTIEVRIKTIKGNSKFIRIRGKPIHDDKADSVRFAGIIRDITKEKFLEAEKAQIHEQLIQSQKMDSIGKLAGGIAHDFNNLLGSILGYASLLEIKLKNDEKNLRKVNIIIRSAERAAELTKQLLGFARKGQYEMKPINLNASIEEARQILYRSIDKTIIVKADLSHTLPFIKGDSSQILQILINLGINARDALPDGGEVLFETSSFVTDEKFCKFHQNLKAGKKYVRLSISDTGTGIPKDLINKIFDPFFTTKAIGKGTGLGLPMVHGIVKNHGGEISVYSEPGHGTQFHLYFPVVENNLVEEPYLPIISQSKEEIDLSQKRILIVDDEEMMRNLACDILQAKKAICLTAINGNDAIIKFEETNEPYSIIVLDIMMPIMDGIKTFKQIRNKKTDQKILFASGYSESDEIRDLIQKGNTGFIQKPFRESDLLEMILKMNV